MSSPEGRDEREDSLSGGVACDCRLLQRKQLDDGASRSAFEMLRALLRREAVLKLFCLGYGEETKGTPLGELLEMGARFVPAFPRTRSTGLDALLAQYLFPRLIRRRGFSLYHALFQTHALRSCPVPQVVTVHDLGPYYSYPDELRARIEGATGLRARPRWQDGLRYKLLRNADVVMASSEYTLNRLVELGLVSSERVLHVSLGVDREWLRRETPPSGTLERLGLDMRYLLMVGRIQPYKNVLGAIRAFKLLCDRHGFDGLLAIAGVSQSPSEAAYQESCRAEAARLGLKDRVRFLGFVSDGDLRGLYAGATVFLQPSFVEGFGLPALEATCMGTRVVTSDYGSLPEVVPGAVKVSPFDPSEIAEGLARAMDADASDPSDGETWSRTADAVASVYETALNRGAGAPAKEG